MRISVISSWLVFQESSSTLKSSIRFFRCLFVAQQWKYFEFLSPCLAHNSLDLYAHIVASLSCHSSISFFNCLTLVLSPLMIASSSALWRSFLNFSNSFRTFPKTFLWRSMCYSIHSSKGTLCSPEATRKKKIWLKCFSWKLAPYTLIWTGWWSLN